MKFSTKFSNPDFVKRLTGLWWGENRFTVVDEKPDKSLPVALY